MSETQTDPADFDDAAQLEHITETDNSLRDDDDPDQPGIDQSSVAFPGSPTEDSA
jgi:hypothetical protein